jgi:hypothetical protein
VDQPGQNKEEGEKGEKYALWKLEDPKARNLRQLLLFSFFAPGNFQAFYPLLIFPVLSS